MENNNLHDIHIAGSGRVVGGEYGSVAITGSGQVDGDLRCADLRVTGSATLHGAAKCTGGCQVSGAGRFEGDIEASEARLSGSARVGGNLTVSGEAKASGSVEIEGDLKAERAKSSGSLKVGGGIECEELTLNGSFTVGGLINAESANITPVGACSADEIGGETVVVNKPYETSFVIFGVNLSFKAPSGRLTANLIEASRVTLDVTTAKTVRGDVVEIGSLCQIDRVEYREGLTVADGAKVLEQVKIP